MGDATVSLAHLQDRIKRDPSAYQEEFELQHRNFLAELEIFKLSPGVDSENFRNLVQFLSHVAPCYKTELAEFPHQMMSLVGENYDVMCAEVRRCIVQSLILMRNRRLIEAIPMLKLCFILFRCKDKLMRETVFSHIVSDVRAVNQVHRDERVNKTIQSFMYTMLADEEKTAAKRSLDVLITLFRKKLWTDKRTVNVIATACLSKVPKLMVAAIKFFLNEDPGADAESDDESEDEENPSGGASSRGPNKNKMPSMHSKKTRARLRKAAKVAERTKKLRQHKKKVVVFPAIQLLNDPQGLAEKLLRRLKSASDRFEVRLVILNFVSRLIGQHKLQVLPFYSYVQRYLNAHQASVTQILAALIQACHSLVPPDELVPVVRAIANNFVSDHRPNEVVQIGLNSMREIFTRVPLVLEEGGMDDLISDLVLYRKSRDKGVVMASRSLLNLVREVYPSILARKDRGKDHVIESRPTQFGASKVKDEWDVMSAGSGEDLEDLVPHSDSDGEEVDGFEAHSEASSDEDGDEEEADGAGEGDAGSDEEREEGDEADRRQGQGRDGKPSTAAESGAAAGAGGPVAEEKGKGKGKGKRSVSFLTPETLAAHDKKASEPTNLSKAALRRAARKRGRDDASVATSAVTGDELGEAPVISLNPEDLEGAATKKRREQIRRMTAAKLAREERWKKEAHGGGTTNAEKARKKNYLMLKKSYVVQAKTRRKLLDQQRALKAHKTKFKNMGTHEKKKRRRS